jgi:hypothetical protein
MENISVLHKSSRIIDNKVRTNFNRAILSRERTTINPAIDDLIAEGGEYFSHYLNFLGLAYESNLLILSSRHHYYYDYSELQGAKTLVNLKRLNLMKHLDSFLHTVYLGLSPKTNFIGCFSDRKAQNGISLFSRMCKRFFNFLDSRIDHDLDKNEVFEILETNGFKIVNMKEMNGLTYFYSQCVPKPIELAC